ncbi:DUF4124 domain-containing protein [Hydrogenophaga sp. PAMC20947]|uniref:DUF4124 domain-containing protein n=1 Tax=Hydrogenophaga sp. PAMC20947 TaxID=2565558 RepID=UPI00109E1B61|nr:DUF4124 domain-containing protein [Hydrogenophaga sp. PAMC20947]QCB48594.1 DUF4124 domain-containing protein [Hydrogenophaga sp. PAMC20947]
MALVLMTSVMSVSAFAQWQWIDNTGRKVFSDTAPPPGIPDKNILKQPGARSPATTATASAAADEKTKPGAASAPALDPSTGGKDEALEAKKKQAEVAAKAEKKAATDRLAKARADNCVQAKQGKATYDSGVRVVITNAKGEREFVDDAKRAEQIKRLNEIIQSDCGPVAQ